MVKPKKADGALALVEVPETADGQLTQEFRFELLDQGITAGRFNEYKDGHKLLFQMEEKQEQIVEITFELECYPIDGIVAMNRAIELAYGFSHAKERMTFFGPRPPRRINVMTGLDTSIHVVYGEMAPPAWEGGSLTISVKGASAPMTLSITGEVKRKFETKINDVVAIAKRLLKKESIYRGRAVALDLSYIGTENFDPANCAPKFIDVSKECNLILPIEQERKLNRKMWAVMRNPENYRENDSPVKRGILLTGEYGTGKSLTSYKTAQIAEECGWSYFYLKTPDKFLHAYLLAQLYGPSVLFVEDCDTIFSGERTAEMNAILETLDGVGAKNAEVITVFTTNHPEKLLKVAKRSGRIDATVKLTAPDAEAAIRFIKLLSERWLAPDIDWTPVGEEFAGLVPADITNAINEAKDEAIAVHETRDIDGKVTGEMLIWGAKTIKEKNLEEGDGLSQSDRDLAIVKKAQSILSPERVSIEEIIGPKVETIMGDVKKVRKALGT
jgi:ATPase family associated with various cellular activities (AAA)